MNHKSYLTALIILANPACWADTAQPATNTPEIVDLNIEDLINVQVTSVSKKAQALSEAPAAIFVISNEDIKRSGATSIPEALRMAPGIDVARINANKWAVSARGFNGSIANKLLVLIDGRSVYTPAFSGVYWDAQDVMLEDVDRIEVIRGPGATLWGANAVNGVINIITKRSEDTQGGLLAAGAGSKETGFGALRYGTKLGQDTFARAYVKGFQRDAFKTPEGLDANDDWHKQQGGFRVDSRVTAQDDVTIQGDMYQGDIQESLVTPLTYAPYHQAVNNTAKIFGGNMTSRLHHSFSSTSEYTLQFYFDHYKRQDFIHEEDRDTLDLDFQHNFSWGDNQNIIWGLDYRYSLDHFAPTPLVKLHPSRRGTQLFSAFLQDEWMLIDDRLWLTIGSKFEHNDYTGFEGQPNIRLMWAPHGGHRVWASVSRSVRTPARAEHNIGIHQTTVLAKDPRVPIAIPVMVTVNGNPNYVSEELLAFELGYRFTIANKASLDLTGFYNDYNKLRSTHLEQPTVSGTFPNISVTQPTTFGNNGSGNTYGFEMATVWQMQDWLRWDVNYSFLKTQLKALKNNQNQVSPQHKVSVRAGLTPIKDVNVDLWLRYNSNSLTTQPLAKHELKVNDYLTLDLRLGWQVHPSLELSITGQNLLDHDHFEYLEETYGIPTEIPRAVYGKLTWQF